MLNRRSSSSSSNSGTEEISVPNHFFARAESEKISMATTVLDRDFIEAVATEIACGVDAAVERWIADIDSILHNPLLTDEDKVFAMGEMVARYKYATGRSVLRKRIN